MPLDFFIAFKLGILLGILNAIVRMSHPISKLKLNEKKTTKKKMIQNTVIELIEQYDSESRSMKKCLRKNNNLVLVYNGGLTTSNMFKDNIKKKKLLLYFMLRTDKRNEHVPISKRRLKSYTFLFLTQLNLQNLLTPSLPKTQNAM